MTEEFRIDLGLGITGVEAAFQRMEELVTQLGESGGAGGEGDLAAALQRDIALMTEYRDKALEVAAAQEKIGTSGAVGGDVYAGLIKSAELADKSIQTLNRSVDRSATGTPSTAALDKFRAGVNGVTSAYAELAAAQERVGAAAVAEPTTFRRVSPVGSEFHTYEGTNSTGTFTINQIPASGTSGKVYAVTPPGSQHPEDVYRTLADAKRAVTTFSSDLGLVNGAGADLAQAEQRAAQVVTLYHGTLQRNIESIQNQGLLAQTPRGSETEPGVFATNDPQKAAAIALSRANERGETSAPAVVSFPAPDNATFGGTPGAPLHRPDFVAHIPNAIPPDQITVEDYAAIQSGLREETAAHKAVAESSTKLATAQTEAAAKVTLSTAEVAAIADRNVSPGIRTQGYTQSLREGTGQFEGQGIAQVGIQKPLQIVQSDIYPQGQLQDGEHRLAAAQQLGLPEVPVEIRNANGDLISAVEFRANAERAAAESAAKTQQFLSEALAESTAGAKGVADSEAQLTKSTLRSKEAQDAAIAQGAAAIRERLTKLTTLVEAPPSTEQNFALEPTPGAPAVVAPRAAGVQEGFAFPENQNLELQPAPPANVKAPSLADKQQKLAAEIEQQAALASEGTAAEAETLQSQRELAAIFKEARAVAKARAAEAADSLASFIRENELNGVARPAGQAGKGEFDFLRAGNVSDSELESFTKAGFVVPPQTDQQKKQGIGLGERPDVVAGRAEQFLSDSSQDPFAYLIGQWRAQLAAAAAANVDITRGGRGLATADIETELKHSGLAPNQITPTVVEAVQGKGSPNKVAGNLLEQGALPAPVFPAFDPEAYRAQQAAQQAQLEASQQAEFERLRLESQNALAAVAQRKALAASVSPEVATIEALQQPELVPAPRPAAPVEKTLEAATGAEQNLVKSINRKIEALDLQTQATTEARLAEGRLAKAADAAATAKRDQADAILKETFPTAGAGGEDATPAAIARRIALLERQLNAKTLGQTRAEGLDNKPPPASPVSDVRNNPSGDFRSKLEEIKTAADLEEEKANSGTGAGSYAAAAARLRTQYERSSANIAQEILSQDETIAAEQNYAKQKARATALQAQVNLSVQQILAKETFEGQKYAETLAQTTALRQQEKASVQALLSADETYAASLAKEALARQAIATETKTQKLQGVGLENTGAGIRFAEANPGATVEQIRAGTRKALAQQDVSNALGEERIKAEREVALATARLAESRDAEASGEQSTAAIQSQAARLNREYAAATKKLVSAQEKAAFDAERAAGNRNDVGRFQIFQSSIASRNGSFRDPAEFLNLGQFLQSRFLTTAGFAVSGVATYAAFAGIQKMLTDGKDLQVVFSQIKAELTSLGDGSAFNQYRDAILQISRNSGEAAKDVAALAFQFKGAFGAKLNDTQILKQVQSAVELARVTGVSLTDIQNSLTSAAVTYGTSIEHVGDVVLTMQDRTGVAAKEMISALSSVDVVAQSVGLTIEQTSAIIGVAAKYSGQPGSTSAEGLNRVIGTIGTKAPQVIRLFEQAAPQAVPNVSEAFATGNTGRVLDELGKSYQNLNLSQKEYLTSLLGGPRNAKVVIDVFQHYGEVLNDVGAAQNSGGRLAKSYAELQGTLAQQLAKVTAALKNIGAALLTLGGADILKGLAIALGEIVKVIGDAVSVLTHLNDATGGWAIKLGEVLLAMKAIAALAPILGGEGGAGLFGSLPFVGTISSRNVAGTVEGQAFRRAGTIAEGTGDFATGTAGKAQPVFVPAAGGEGAPASGLGRLGQRISTAGEDSGFLISKTTGLLGGVLEGLGAAIVTFAPVLLIGAIIEGINSFQTGLENAKKRQVDLNNSLAGYSTGQLIAGANDPNSDIGKQLKAYSDQQVTGLSVSDLHPTQLFKDAGSVLSGAKSASDLLADQVQKRTTKGFATVLTQSFSKDDQKKLIDQVNKEVGSGSVIGGTTLSVDDLQKIAGNGTTDNKQFEAILKLFTDASTRKKGLGKAYLALFADGEKYAKLQGDVTSQLQDFPTLQIQQSTGQISSSEFVSITQHDIDETRRLLIEAIKKNAPPDYIDGLKKTLDSEQSAKDQVLSAAIQAAAAGSAAASLVSGANTSDTNLAAIQAGTAALRIPNALTSKDAPAIAQQVVKAQQTQLQYMADHAKTVAEAQAILDAGFKIDPVVLQALQIGQLNALPPALETALKDSATETSQDFEKVILKIVQAKGGIREGIRAYIEALKHTLQELIANSGDKGEIAKLQAQIPVLNGLLTDPSLLTSNVGKAANVAAPTAAENRAAADTLAKALVANNPLKAAQEAQAEAARNLNEDLLKASDKKSTPEARAVAGNAAKTDQANLVAANNQYNTALDSIAQAQANVAASLANGDPVKAALAAINTARVQLRAAERNGDKAGILNAQAALNNAYFQFSQSQQAIATALIGVQNAQADGNPLLAAQAAVAAANVQAANAHGRAEQLNALAAQISAQHQLRDAMNAIADAQESVVLAMLNAAGDVVGAANEQVKKDKADLTRYISQHPGATAANDPQVSNLTAKVITDQAAARDALLNKQESDIQFALDTNKISTGQAIVRLQNLLSTANITEAERQNIERQIFQLKQQITKDLQFDLPSLTGDLGLAGLLYQSRRLGETGAAGQGYQDNRQINININGTNLTQTQLVDAVTTAVNQPPRHGTFNRSY